MKYHHSMGTSWEASSLGNRTRGVTAFADSVVGVGMEGPVERGGGEGAGMEVGAGSEVAEAAGLGVSTTAERPEPAGFEVGEAVAVGAGRSAGPDAPQATNNTAMRGNRKAPLRLTGNLGSDIIKLNFIGRAGGRIRPWPTKWENGTRAPSVALSL